MGAKPASVVTWREVWRPGADMATAFAHLYAGEAPQLDATVEKAQLAGPVTLVAMGVADDALPHRLAVAASRLAGSFPHLREIWIDEPCLTHDTADVTARAVREVRAAVPEVRIGLHTCAEPQGVEHTGADVWHGDAWRYESAWVTLARTAPPGVEVVFGMVPTDGHATDVELLGRLKRIERALGTRVRRIAPACGLGTHSASAARAVLAQLERARGLGL